MHALIIEDDVYSIEVLSKLLNQQGIAYSAVQDARKVEPMSGELASVDLVFLDLEMPWIDGYEMLRILGEFLRPEVPVIACSVHTNEALTARDLGFHSFISKPLDMERFPEQIQHILNNDSIWDI
jgi:CheY-like chemotaxis protein